jgi:mannose-1-phosphate guanylyltransferase/phosphomannomutase
VVSHNTTIRENAILQANIKIWPEKEIEAGATVSTSLVYGSQGRRNLFGHYGVSGLVNIELTPEFCAKLGAAFGATLRKGSTVTINRAAHNTARVLKRALLSGVPSAGANVNDTATLPLPVFRYYTRASNAAGGVHVRLSPFDQRVVDIKFIADGGLDLSARAQRSMENVFFREDIRRVYLDEIGQIRYAQDAAEVYQRAFHEALQPGVFPVQTRYDHLVVDYANSTTSLVLPDILNALKCDIVGVGTLPEQHMLVRSRAEWAESMSRLAAITHALGANFGVRLDVEGERVFFTSNDSKVISDTEALIAMVTLVFMAVPNAHVAVPVTAPRQLEEIAARYGGSVSRLRLGDNVMMEEATQDRHTLIGDDGGGFIFPAFSPFLDGMFTIVKVMEMTAHVQQSFSAIWRARTPFYTSSATMSCPWEQKGTLMRLLRERFSAPENECVEGVQVPLGDEWVIIYPDPAEPRFVVHAEATDLPSAVALVDKYRSLVNSLVVSG